MSEPTTGERAADTLRATMGSWRFVFAFLAWMALWAVANTVLLRHRAFDPYPFILLNLLLSTLAGLQGAIILISERRGEQLADQRQRGVLLKLDELIKVTKGADDALIGIEEQAQEKIDEVKDHITEQVKEQHK